MLIRGEEGRERDAAPVGDEALPPSAAAAAGDDDGDDVDVDAEVDDDVDADRIAACASAHCWEDEATLSRRCAEAERAWPCTDSKARTAVPIERSTI